MNNSRDSCEAKPKQNTKASSIMRIEEVVLISSKLSKISISESVERYLSSSASLRKFSNKNKRKLQLFKFENRKAQASKSKLALIRSKKIFPNFCLTNLKASLLNVRRFIRLIFSSWTQKWFTIFLKKLSIKFLSLINKIVSYILILSILI